MKFLSPILLLFLLASSAMAQVAVVHPSVPEQTPTPARIRDLFLGRATTWEDGTPVVIVLVEDETADAALQKITSRDGALLQRGWKRLAFSGNGSMPLMASSLSEAFEKVSQNRGAVAILMDAIADPRWRVVRLDSGETLRDGKTSH